MSVEVLNGCETMMKETRQEMSGLAEIVCDIAFPRPERVYPHALLVELKEHPVAQRWPPYLDPIYKNARGVWDPDRWHHDRKRGDTPVLADEKLLSVGQPEPLPTKVPVKRLREKDVERVSVQEEDSIVLSPQRRSFLTGCQATQDDLVLKPEQPTGGRRVGSGRILAREPSSRPEDFPNKPPPPRARTEREAGRGEPRDTWGDQGGRDYPNKFPFRPREVDEDRRAEWDERRDDRRNNYYQHDDRDGRNGDRRGMMGGNGGGGMGGGRGRMGGGPMGGGGMKRGRQESEPEWMSESVSMSDMIELRGFDEPKPSLKPGMSLEELEQLQQQEVEPKLPPQPPDVQQQQQRSASRASAKSDKEAVVAAANRSLADFLKSGRVVTTPIAAETASAHAQPSQTLPPGLLEAIMGGGGGAQVSGGESGAVGGFNFDSIMMESVNLSSLLGGMGNHFAEGSGREEEGASFGNSGAVTQADQPQQQQQPSQNNQQSRFSQFFSKAAPAAAVAATADQQSRRSSIQDELLGSNILREINGEATIRIPSPEEVDSSSSSKYFTPISPAAKTGGPPQGASDLLEMLKKGGGGGSGGHQQPQPPPQGERVVRQLEDGIKRSLGLGDQQPQLHQQQLGGHHGFLPGPPGLHHQFHGGLLGYPHHLQQQQQQAAALRPQHRPQQPTNQDNDMSAFKKLVAQVKAGGPSVSAPPPPMDATSASLLGLIRPAPLAGPGGSGGGGGVRLYTEQDIVEGKAKGQQQRARFSHPAIPPPLIRFLEQYPWNPEVMKRPDAEHLIMGLNSGAFQLENIVLQLSNPALQVRQRELILTVLKLKTSGMPPPPSTSSHNAAPFLAGPALLPPRTSPLPGQQQQQYVPQHHSGRGVSPLMSFPPGATSHLAVSPVPPSQRVPSPQEMTVLTQQILQQALIKRKLEEQKENYRRRQGEGRQDKEDKENIRGLKNADPSSSGAVVAPSAVGGVTGSPLAFTPTSVMRKNAAERKDSDPRLGVPELKISNQDRGSGARADSKQAPPSPGRPITKAKIDRPDRLELANQYQQLRGSRQSPNLNPGLNPGLLGPAPGQPTGGFNPLLFLQNPQIRASHNLGHDSGRGQGLGNLPLDPSGLNNPPLDPRLMFGGGSQNHLPAAFLAAAAAAGGAGNMGAANNRLPAAFLAAAAANNHPHSSRPQQHQAVSPSGGGLSRFFSPDVLAAAQGGACPPMPPLPIRQALTLEEIERQAAAAAVRI